MKGLKALSRLCHPYKYIISKEVLNLRTLGIAQSRNLCSSLSNECSDNTALYPTEINIYNAVTNQVVPLKTIKPNILTWYICGPTVYDTSHIGHARCYVSLDIMKRIMKNIFNITVFSAMGITNIDDKIIARAKLENENTMTLASKYEKEFYTDMRRLNIDPPSVYLKAVDHIPHMVSFIEKLVEKGYAYVTHDSVYFDVSSYKNYFRLVRSPIDNVLVENDPHGKRRNCDFLLWKLNDDNPFDSPWGKGRPGWHIECSTMTTKLFGDKLDLHSGGSDLLYPHHEAEEAQCCAYHDRSHWCNYWSHTGLLCVKGDIKMSKSLQNTISIPTMLKSCSSNAFRMFCLYRNYKSTAECNPEHLTYAEKKYNRIIGFFEHCSAYLTLQLKCPRINEDKMFQVLEYTKSEVRKSLANDFNTKEAVDFIDDLITAYHREFTQHTIIENSHNSIGIVLAVYEFVWNFFNDLGFQIQKERFSNVNEKQDDAMLSNVISSAVHFRSKIKNVVLSKGEYKEVNLSEKEMKKCLLILSDRMRDNLNASGIKVKDAVDHATWSFSDEEDKLFQKAMEASENEDRKSTPES